MKRLLAALAALVTLIALAQACGRYGPPHRVMSAPERGPSAPVTDPAMPR